MQSVASYRAAGREPTKAAVSLPPAGLGEDYSSQRYQVKLFASFFSKKDGPQAGRNEQAGAHPLAVP